MRIFLLLNLLTLHFLHLIVLILPLLLLLLCAKLLPLLLPAQVPLESVCLIDKYSWLETERGLGDQLIARLAKNMTVPLAVIR